MEVRKIKQSCTHYEADFEEEILRMLNSGKNVDEISKRNLGLVEMFFILGKTSP